MTLGEENQTLNLIILAIVGIVTLILFIIVMVLTKKVKVTEYVRNPEMLLDPIISEAIIDRKIGAKELIMSCIVELIYRKKLRNIGNDAVEIVDLNEISEYERDIVNLVFGGMKKITFDEIKKIFWVEDKKTEEFYNKFKEIKQKIEDKIYKYNIYSKIGEKILKIIKVISNFVLIVVGYLFTNSVFRYNWIQYGFVLMILSVLFMGIKLFNKKSRITRGSSERGAGAVIFMCGLIVISFYAIIIILSIEEHLIMILGTFIIVIFNIIILNKTKLHVFTEYGKIEYAKTEGLKKYIQDYSLMEERELDSVIVWDEYLAYSVAFGISNKVSRKFSENLMEANIIIQKIDSFLRM